MSENICNKHNINIIDKTLLYRKKTFQKITQTIKKIDTNPLLKKVKQKAEKHTKSQTHRNPRTHYKYNTWTKRGSPTE